MPGETPLDRFRRACAQPEGGAVGLTDELLAIASALPIIASLEWRGGRCFLRLRDSADPAHEEEVPLPRSVLRAILARVATLGNQQVPGAFTPYGGSGRLRFSPDAFDLEVSLTNTATEQRLHLQPRSSRDASRRATTVRAEQF